MIFGHRALAALVLAVAISTPAMAQDARTVPQSRSEMQLSFAPLVKQTANAVVNVYAERVVERRSIFAGDPFFEEFFGQRMPNRTEKQSSLGSGVIVGRHGLVVTNNHVIEGADDIKVALADGREFPCKIILKDDRLDLAVLKIQSDGPFDIVPIGDSDAVEVGDLVLAMGNPFGVGQTVTSGIVSALARNQISNGDFGFFIQTDAAINPGNSGGGLINMKGELIGINTAIFSRGGGSNGVGFAIPANLVKVFVASAE
ncbi:trypsin-like peptidase domain-containing protein, partial [Sinorhizobium meliloti]